MNPASTKPYSFLRFVLNAGGQGLRKRDRSTEVPQKHPRRKEARELALQELEDAALTFLLERDRLDSNADALETEARERRDKESAEAIKLWSKAGTKPQDVAEFMHAHDLATVHLFNGGQRTAYDGKQAIGKASEIALTPPPGRVILSVADADAEEFTARYELPHTLTWCAGGYTHRMYTAGAWDGLGGQPKPIKGERVMLAAYSGYLPGDQVYASLTGCKWLVPPSKAITKGKVDLAGMPLEVAKRLSAIQSGSHHTTVDAVMLG